MSGQETQAVPSYVELADSESLIGDEAEKPDSQEFRVYRVERMWASMGPERRY